MMPFGTDGLFLERLAGTWHVLLLQYDPLAERTLALFKKA